MLRIIEKNVAIPEHPETKETGELIINTNNITTFESKIFSQSLDKRGSVLGKGVIIIINGISYTIFLQNTLELDFEENFDKYLEYVNDIIEHLE
jgi:hypothetical protein